MPLSLSRCSVFADGLDHPECLALHPDGHWYAGGEAGQIYRISPDGTTVKQVASTGGFVLGLAVSPDGKWLALCDLKHKAVFKLDLNGLTLSELTRGGREPFGIPNHLAFTRDGRLFVTDSGAFRKVTGRIYRFDADGDGGVWHRGPFNFANGIALAPGEDAVFVCCTWLGGVERVEIRPDGSAGKRSIYATLPARSLPDGLAFDARGNLYVTCYTPARIYKINPRRQVSVLVDDWEAHLLANPTNIAFGGPGFDELYAANLGRWHLTRIKLNARGLPLACHPQAARAPRPRI